MLLWLPDMALFPIWGIGIMLAILCYGKWRFALLFAGIVILLHGQAWFVMHQAKQSEQLPAKLVRSFKIVEILHQQQYQRLVVETTLLPDNPAQRIYVLWQVAESQPQLGEIWQGELLLRPLSSRLNQQGFDRQQWALAKGISLQARVKSAVKIAEDFSWRERRLKRAWQQTQELSEQGLLLALAFGERAWLNPDTWQMYQQTNTAHLIAISGLHIGIAMGIGFLVGRLLQFVLPTRYINGIFPFIVGFMVALLYAQLAGFSIPTLRAIIALAVLLFFRWRRGYCVPWQLFLRTVAILLIVDPLMLLSASFWLSVGAVACLILWYQLFPLWIFEWRGKAFTDLASQYLWGIIHLQFGLFCLFTPIQLAIFHGFSLYSFWANLMAVPFYSLLLVPLVLFATFTEGLFASWYWANELVLLINQGIAYWQGGWLFLSQKIILFLTALCALWLASCVYWVYQYPRRLAKPNFPWQPKRCFPLGLSSERALSPITRTYVYIACVSLVVYCGGQWLKELITKPHWRLETLDVGQGQATLLVKNNKAILYDSGASWQGGDMASLEILPYLFRQGIQLEKLIVSHDDNDHAGGVPTLLKAFPSLKLIQSSTFFYQTQDVDPCYRGKTWHWQGLTLQALSPPQIVARANNKDSCVLLIDDGRYSVLLTGDADITAEREFIEQITAPIDILQVGHHGSQTSTSELLLGRTKPQVALISSGRWNPWRLPNKQVIERLIRHKIQVFNTAQDGQISVFFYTDRFEIKTARDKFSPWYRIIIGEPSK
nr:DNA internalization-related competence protein ComEC/Rec2 [Volucribacter amazonae]